MYDLTFDLTRSKIDTLVYTLYMCIRVFTFYTYIILFLEEIFYTWTCYPYSLKIVRKMKSIHVSLFKVKYQYKCTTYKKGL